MKKSERLSAEEFLQKATMDFSQIDRSFVKKLRLKFLEAAQAEASPRPLSDDELELAAAAMNLEIPPAAFYPPAEDDGK